MATARSAPTPAAAPEPLPQPSYPALERFIEDTAPENLGATFESLRAGLAALKGPKAEQAKKVAKAIERTEELLSYLMQVREKLEQDQKGAGGTRK